MASEMVTLPAAAIPDLRRMLIIGLRSYGECDRVQRESRAAKDLGLPVDPNLIPLMLTGGYEAASFAEALSWLDFAEAAEAA